MKILVYGAGPLGSLFASQLHEAGHKVALLARGQRLAELRQHGVVLVDTLTGQETISHPQIVEQLDEADGYDLVLVVMRKNRALDILPVLAANRHTPNVLFLMNNAAGPDALTAALGEERVMMGFPMAGGYKREHVVTYMAGAKPGEKARVPIGEPGGVVTQRLMETAKALDSTALFTADIQADIDAWLKTHVALLMPSLAPALFGAGLDNVRLAHTRDLIVLAIRAMREGFAVLKALGYPITPTYIKMLALLPEPLLVAVFQKRLVDPSIRVALVEHAEAAQDEIVHLVGEFRDLILQTKISTPAINHLACYFDPDMPRMPEGSAEIPLDWRSTAVSLGAMAAGLGGVWLYSKRARKTCQQQSRSH